MNDPTLHPAATNGGTDDDGDARSPRGIQSIEVGGQLLKALVRAGSALALKDLARAAGMTPAKAHPYLVSFGKLGLVEQDAVSGRYGLGPLALQLGLIGLQQVDPVRLAVAQLPALAAQLGCTVSAAVWGPMGPIIVHVEHGPTPVHVAMRHGTPASLRHTGTGKVFAAFAPPQAVAEALLERIEVLEDQAARIRADRDGLAERLGQLPGVTVFPSAANFVLVRVPDAGRAFAGMKARRVLVRNFDGAHPLLANCLRLTVGTPEENELMLAALSESL
ncbi:MAG: helix-turn-helix domain-containing protein [Burkholderiales bacterium]|nr:helix-turn-helix domain-containing protein [Burkholderiales bacterium]